MLGIGLSVCPSTYDDEETRERSLVMCREEQRGEEWFREGCGRREYGEWSDAIECLSVCVCVCPVSMRLYMCVG